MVTSYGAPAVTSVTCTSANVNTTVVTGTALAPTAGGGVVSLTGQNFGADINQITVFWNLVPVLGVTLKTPHSLLQFPSLPGDDNPIGLRVLVGGQWASDAASVSALSSLRFSAPIVHFLSVVVEDAAAPIDCSRIDSNGLPVGQSGKFTVVEITGSNFGLGNYTTVLIGSVQQQILSHSHSGIVVRTPACVGV